MFTIIRNSVVTQDKVQMFIHTFCRDSDSMLVGQVQQNGTASFGEDPNDQMQRWFIDEKAALDWVKEKCRDLAGRADIDFKFVDKALRDKLAVSMPTNLH